MDVMVGNNDAIRVLSLSVELSFIVCVNMSVCWL